MTSKELKKLYELNRDIEYDQQRLRELRAAATNTNSKITGLPHAPHINDKTALAVEINYLDGVIQAKILQSLHEYNRLTHYIDNIDDPHIRQIFKLYHINGLNFYQVARHIGGKNTKDSVEQAYYRYLRKQNKSCQ